MERVSLEETSTKDFLMIPKDQLMSFSVGISVKQFWLILRVLASQDLSMISHLGLI
jgi:hypothetical protein